MGKASRQKITCNLEGGLMYIIIDNRAAAQFSFSPFSHCHSHLREVTQQRFPVQCPPLSPFKPTTATFIQTRPQCLSANIGGLVESGPEPEGTNIRKRFIVWSRLRREREKGEGRGGGGGGVAERQEKQTLP